MGTWGTNIYENDAASDLKADFLDHNKNEFLETKVSDFVTLPKADRNSFVCEEVLAASDLRLSSKEIINTEFAQNVAVSLQFILDESELKEQWEESGEFDEWVKGVGLLMQKLAANIENIST
jgi:hypothetical protein